MNREAAGDALMLEALVMARRDPAFRTTLRDRMADEESHLATLIDNGKDAGIIDPTLSTRAILTLCQAISLGFVVMGAIEKPTPTPTSGTPSSIGWSRRPCPPRPALHRP